MAKAAVQRARGAIAGLLAGLVCLTVSAAARAQALTEPPPATASGAQTPPPAEAPLAPMAAPPAPAPGAPPAASEALAPLPPAAPSPAPPAPVQGEALNPLDLFSAGRDMGLGSDLWRGASAGLARAVIPTLGDHALSPAGAALARRVLAQSASAPDGAGADADLASARARALLMLGDAPTAELILDHTAGLANSPALSETAAEAALIDGEDDKACAIGDALGSGRDGAYWLRLRAYCEARAGKPAAQLTMNLAEEADHDPAFARMLPVIIAGGGDPGPASLRDGLDFAMSRQLKLDLTPAIAAAPPAIALRLAASAAGLGPAPPASAATPEPDILAGLRKGKGAQGYLTAARLALPAIVQLVQAKSALTAPVQLAMAALAAGDIETAQAIRLGLADAPAGAVDPSRPRHPGCCAGGCGRQGRSAQPRPADRAGRPQRRCSATRAGRRGARLLARMARRRRRARRVRWVQPRP